MFVFLSKLLPQLVYPLGLGCILLIAALLLRRRLGWQRAAILAALVILWIGGNRWVAMGLTRSLEERYRPPDTLPHGDVIVLLGGGTESPAPPRPMVEINSSGYRVLYTAWLYKQGVAPHILSSGGLLDWSTAPTLPSADMANLLEFMGVPADAIWQQSKSRNTYEDAVYSAEILRQKGISHILLVTSAFHMPRSVRLFEDQGLEVTPLPVDYNVTDSQWSAETLLDPRTIILGLMPSADNLSMTTKILKEYLGMLVYDLGGRY